jgi:hypothetical protein
MKGLCVGIITIAVLFAAACKASEPPTQVVYRFDDHRYLELKGWNCEANSGIRIQNGAFIPSL